MKILTTPRMERCIGCHSCSLACARLVHKRLSWDTAGIRIRSSGGISTGFEPRLCLACDPAPCVMACPTGAYSQRKGGGVVVKKKLCIRCGACAKACPVDAIELTSLYNLSGKSREEMIFDKEKLLSVYDLTKDREPMKTKDQGSMFKAQGEPTTRNR